MIFVVLGTWDKPFLRPLREIEQAVRAGQVNEQVIVQSGNTLYATQCLQLVPFFAQNEFERMYEQADLIICQAGVGSIMLGLKKQKKIIAIARRSEFEEHIDDHQLEILDVFAKAGNVLRWEGNGDLLDILQRAKSFAPAGYSFGRERISRAILEYLHTAVRLR